MVFLVQCPFRMCGLDDQRIFARRYIKQFKVSVVVRDCVLDGCVLFRVSASPQGSAATHKILVGWDFNMAFDKPYFASGIGLGPDMETEKIGEGAFNAPGFNRRRRRRWSL